MMESTEIRKRFLDFFARRKHTIVPSSSLIPDDQSVLLTTAGMQQFKSYYTGEADPIKDFGGKNAASIQKSFRTSDIDEVGDESHLTFFEMLGNFSFGGYFKEEAVRYAYEFFKELGLPIESVTVFGGDSEVPADAESEKIWRGLGVARIERRGREDNFWGPTGSEGPCGPTTEIHIQGLEVWNIVFNQYYCKADKTLVPLDQNGVDTGMGLERMAMILQGGKTIFDTDLFTPIIEKIRELAQRPDERAERIIADHLRAAAFILGDDKAITPSNTERGYILRRLIRRAVRYGKVIGIDGAFTPKVAEVVINLMSDIYAELKRNNDFIIEQLMQEEIKFKQSLAGGIKIFQKVLRDKVPIKEDLFSKIMVQSDKKEILRKIFAIRKIGGDCQNQIRKLSPEITRKEFDEATITGEETFNLYQTHGFPIEMIVDLAQEGHFFVDIESFREQVKKHQEISRAGRERKFGGHGLILDTGELKAASEEELEKVTRLHTATHLLNAALHKVLGNTVEQRGSDITVERARFDFAFSRKLTAEELKKIEDLVNGAIQKNFTVNCKEMDTGEAKRSGALYFYKGNYPPRVKVWTIGDDKEVFSRELCGGPHVKRAGEIGQFKITKEESSSAGVRRIRAAVEP